MRRLAAELIGTFMLVGAVLGAAVVSGNAAGLGVAFAIGLSVMAMIYAVGPISGGHFNPAVTVGLWAAGRFEPARIIPYVLAQLAGGILAALFFYVVLSGKADFTVGGYASTGYGKHSAGGFSRTSSRWRGATLPSAFSIDCFTPGCSRSSSISRRLAR